MSIELFKLIVIFHGCLYFEKSRFPVCNVAITNAKCLHELRGGAYSCSIVVPKCTGAANLITTSQKISAMPNISVLSHLVEKQPFILDVMGPNNIQCKAPRKLLHLSIAINKSDRRLGWPSACSVLFRVQKAEQALGYPREYNVRTPLKNSEKIVLNVHLWGKKPQVPWFYWTLLAIKKNDKRGLKSGLSYKILNHL